ncbi:MAG TPA: alpha/beta hydrolase, partial [Ottowia sp.]|nr:alpha/beta hydrolase [Ottowia sp.]
KGMDKSQHSFLVPALRALGAAVVVPNYALCPKVTIPQITLQMVQATAWAWRHAADFNGDARRVVVMGHSAGGQLAAMMLACAWPVVDAALPADLVKGALGISGLYDLQPIQQTPSLQEVLRLTPAQVAQASPARLPAPARGRLFSVVGGDESGEYLRQNRLIQQAWGRERVPVAAALPGLNHFSVLEALARRGTRLHGLARQLLA